MMGGQVQYYLMQSRLLNKLLGVIFLELSVLLVLSKSLFILMKVIRL